MFLSLCCGAKMDEPATEYDEIPYSLRWRMSFGKTECDPNTGLDIMRLSNNRLVQTHCSSTEYQALRMIAKQTSIPAYRVINVYNRPEGKVVEYEGVPGKNLEKHWNELSLDKKRRVTTDLARFVEQLRKMVPPKHFVIGDSTMGAALDPRFGPGRVGPFYSLEAFHEFLRRGHEAGEFDGTVGTVHGRPYVLKFTHGGLRPSNVLIDESGRVCAVIGWEGAGWYPEYWEYVSMCQNDAESLVGEEWFEMMKAVVPKYEDELECDRALRARFRSEDYGKPRSIRPQSPSESMLRVEMEEIADKNTENTSG